jgi:peptide/nickel transport system substrate-binding protein
MKPTPAPRKPIPAAGVARRLSTLLRGLVAAGALAAGLSACGGGGSAATGATGSAAANAKPVQGGTIYYGHEQEPPCLIGGWVQEAYIDRQILDSLVSQVSSGRIVPWLATSWSVSRDHLTWTFHLKPGVKFTDGTPLNAQAVVDNFKYWLAPSTGNSTVQSYIGSYYKSSRAVDDTTVELQLNAPYSPLLSALSQGYFGILSPTALKRGVSANCEDPIGSGPFILQKWNHGQNLVFVRNPNYNSAPANARHQGPPYVSKVVWSFLGNPATRYGSLTSGQSNVIYDVPTVNWPDAKQRFGVEQYITPGRPVTFSLNTHHGVFTDVRVRQAFAYGGNRRAAVQSAFNGAIPYNGNGALSQSTPGYDASLANAYAFDPAKANALLNQAGWTGRNAAGYRTKGGRELDVKIVYPAGPVITPEGATMLQDIQQQEKAVGFNVTLLPMTPSQTFSGQFSTPTSYDAITWYWTSPTAGVLYIVWRPWDDKKAPNGNNSSFYDNPRLVSDIAKANSSLDPAVQRTYYDKAQQIIVGQAAAVGIYTQTTSLAWQKSLHGIWVEDSQGEPVFSDAFFGR